MLWQLFLFSMTGLGNAINESFFVSFFEYSLLPEKRHLIKVCHVCSSFLLVHILLRVKLNLRQI